MLEKLSITSCFVAFDPIFPTIHQLLGQLVESWLTFQFLFSESLLATTAPAEPPPRQNNIYSIIQPSSRKAVAQLILTLSFCTIYLTLWTQSAVRTLFRRLAALYHPISLEQYKWSYSHSVTLYLVLGPRTPSWVKLHYNLNSLCIGIHYKSLSLHSNY